MGRIILTDDGITLYDSGVASSTPPAPVSPPSPPDLTDLLFGRPEPSVPREVAPASGWIPSPAMRFADCTGQNIPLNPSTSYTITECPPNTIVGTNITTLPCDPYVLTVNGVATPHPVQTGQCTVYASGSTVTVSVAPMMTGVVNLILQIH